MRPIAAAFVLGLLAFHGAGAAAGDGWPARKALTMVLPAGAGGSSDPLARLLALEMGQRLGQTIVVQNRPGAGGNVGMAQAARAQPDGYTMVISWTGPLATNLALYKDVGYDPRADFAPVGMVGCTPNVLAVSGDFPANSLAEFEAYAKTRKSKLSYGTTGVGSSWHIAGEMLSREMDNGLVHIPYQTPGAALTDMKAGRLDAIFPVVPMTVGHVRAGDMKVLAVFSKERALVLPDAPTTVEQGRADLISDTCFALLAPKGVDAAALAALNKALNEVLQDPGARPKIEAMGIQIRAGEPAALAQYLDAEIPRQARLVQASGATAQ
ncbi:tripartite tricarboxylate transporter family receptor [Bordetella bronchiseptica MBORD675]|uniref:Bug family tripartite tricarboxylate transporter substrate binding protein n=1 Tax=Bordetella bronchiseptica TaxID=518 RepID=UPI00028FE70D|nr:tripartite tricarboxylate transporter substrate binding protein [Bordetella bronchiseptica]KDC93371.1 tripartite tricarboxylate transporter family receptor [Bordetella bronchiseptica MBORD675]CCN03060.1 putative exported protein [Bordetella bronchiseptica Bbr77]